MRKKSAWFVSTKECEKAFQTFKNFICNTPGLPIPNFNKEFYLDFDANNLALGPCLLQKDKNGELKRDHDTRRRDVVQYTAEYRNTAGSLRAEVRRQYLDLGLISCSREINK
ncbi:hypothetical protein J6590_102533 [Homalodisca vitripennis]|nr:hypothetical protein J6590_102533 [Homalodisca vitripennis]